MTTVSSNIRDDSERENAAGKGFVVGNNGLAVPETRGAG